MGARIEVVVKESKRSPSLCVSYLLFQQGDVESGAEQIYLKPRNEREGMKKIKIEQEDDKTNQTTQYSIQRKSAMKED